MLLSVRGRLRFSLKATVGIALGIVAAVSLACGIGVAAFAGEEGVWATVPVLAVSLLSLAALTKLPWGKRLFVFFSAATAAAIAILAYDVLLRTVALEWNFGARRVLDAVVCSAGPLVLTPLFARTIRWGVDQVDDPALWRRLAAVPAGFFVAANALYLFAYAVEFLSFGSDVLYALAVSVLAFLMVASYIMLFSALRTVMENARLRETAQLEELQHERYENLRRTLRDTAKARELKSDGNYERFPEYKTGLSAQEQFMAEALENADTEKPHTEGWLHRKVREKVTRWYRSLTSDLD